MFRIGNGIDFHKLIHEPFRPLMLAGVEVKSEYAFLGHSDADVILHAVSDAILGALSLGDIGQHFPDTDPSIKNINSSLITQKCISLITERGWKLVNVDCTYVGDLPKINPIRSELIQSLANILSLPLDCVSIKATTSEGMGALGRSEGVMVMATALLEKSSKK
ncbi:2-C-methyl-D-erythritol 2,4-cyclodiphosphate synthase [Leptospira kobayashii]|uniref:2-C-methyl-D-erythritol 2,4-cyclodiphosphate synthase n=1 Tax=Leptospira kobayashii TaxID=1917830 RepID=A0ABN6K961_9LEPT|nr:2-C-methyl-D-erythritol 2,4-cyclodiphosphate synthase [Leptospira kobayashii]BDA77348.1 2-C-methyl-D-erythritol 2,4-cyclodiphosphate synthase [Leptospira kobayashii]